MGQNPGGLSDQDIKDLQDISTQLPAGDPRQKKIMLLLNSSPTQFEQDRQGANTPGQHGAAMSALQEGMGIVGGIARMGTGVGPDITQIPQTAAQVALNIQNRQQEGRALPYQIAAGATDTVLPVTNARKMEDQADAGNTAGVAGTALADLTPVAIGVARGGIKTATTTPLNKAVEMFNEAQARSVRSQYPEAANMPTNAVLGAEKVFRAAAPVGSNPGFRGALYSAAGDLADIGKTIELQEAKGGVIQPDMRVRATVNAINDHLQQMYQTERAPQIARNAQNPVPIQYNADAQAGLQFLAKNAGTAELRALAQRALEATPENPLTLADVDNLARQANKELAPFNKMTPEQRAANEATSKNVAGMQALDGQLGDAISQELGRRGEAGIKEYEQRYATLSQIRNQLQSRMNAVELAYGPWEKLGQATRVLTGGPKGIASASQAAVANVNIGKELQVGLQQLADSGLTATKGTPGTAPTIRGLLPERASGPIALGQGSIEGRPAEAPWGNPQEPTPVAAPPGWRALNATDAAAYVRRAAGDVVQAERLAQKDGATLGTQYQLMLQRANNFNRVASFGTR